MAVGVHLSTTIEEERRVAISHECNPVKTGKLVWRKTNTLKNGLIIALAGGYCSTWEKGINDGFPYVEPSPNRPALHSSGFEQPSIA